MRHGNAFPLFIALLLALSACGVTPETASTGSDDGNKHGWLLKAHDNFIGGSTRLCADDPVIYDRDGEFAGALTEENGGPPDSWKPGDDWEVDDGIQFDFVAGTYYLYFGDGEVPNQTLWEFNGTFDLKVDGDGIPMSGSGTGTGRILHPNGDVESDVPDVVEMTFSEIPEPTWCKYSYDDDGNLIEN